MENTTRKLNVELTAKERKELKAIVRRQSVGAAKQRRARILLLADVNHPDGRRTDANIAELVNLCERQVVRIRQKFVRERGSQSVVAACERKPRPPAPHRRRLDGKAEAQLVVLACSAPPEGRDRWTLQLLCDELVRLEVVESIAVETVRKCLKKTSSNHGGRSGTVSRKQTGLGSWPRWKRSSMFTNRRTMSGTC
jgi:Homeodomain-like domain